MPITLTIELGWPHLLAALPWLGFLAYAVFRVRLPRELPGGRQSREAVLGADSPLVSVVIPARNEARNIVRVMRTVAASDYPAFEMIVVDDRSDDVTLSIARAEAARIEMEQEAAWYAEAPPGPRRVIVIEGNELPEGWLGKPWACFQGVQSARGELLLFTDADTTHGTDLMVRAVAALDEVPADAVSVTGDQILGSFWERLVQPHIFTTLLFRFPDQRRPLPPERWRDAIANGQYLLFRRPAYEAIGGHEAVRCEVAEDLRLAQILVKSGHRLSVRMAEGALATRMYTSLSEIIEGWSKNIVVGGRQSLPRWAAGWLPALGVPIGIGMWHLPPFLFFWGMARLVLTLILPSTGAVAAEPASAGLPLGWAAWGALVSFFSAGFWAVTSRRLGAGARYGLLYPLGAGVGLWILARAVIRGGTVEWKGRTYQVDL